MCYAWGFIEDIKLLSSKRNSKRTKSSIRKNKMTKESEDNKLHYKFDNSEQDIMKDIAPSSVNKNEEIHPPVDVSNLSLESNYLNDNQNESAHRYSDLHRNDRVEDDPGPTHRRRETNEGLIYKTDSEPPDYDST